MSRPDIKSAIHNLRAQLGMPVAAGSMTHPGPPDANPPSGDVGSTEDLSALPVAKRRPRHRSTYIPLVAQAAEKARR